MRQVLFFFTFLYASFSFGLGEVPISLEKVQVNVHDKMQVFRGAKFYAQNCMVCHTMRYLRHDKLAEEAGVTLDKMPLKQKKWWLDIVPPDLTLLAKRRSPNWIYTYLHSFYKDESRPTGYNNLLVKDINMPNLFVATQGTQELTADGKRLLQEGGWRKPHYYNVLTLVHSGSLTPEQFDQKTKDLVTFFVYAADPDHSLRIKIGLWVMLFLVIFLSLMVLLKKAYWRKINKKP